MADLGLRLDEAKRLTAAMQAEMVPAQVAMVGERRRGCEACGRALAGKGHYGATFRSLSGNVPVRVRRLLTCSCQRPDQPKSIAALALGNGAATAAGTVPSGTTEHSSAGTGAGTTAHGAAGDTTEESE